MTYRMAAILVTLSDCQGQSPTVRLSKCYFLFYCAAADKISIDIVRRAVQRVPQQEAQLSQKDRETRYVSKFMLCFTRYGS